MIILHHCHESRSMRSLWLIHELQLDVEVITHGFGADLRTAEYLSIHPLGRVPCLIDEDVTLFETGAITEWLCQKYDEKHRLGRPHDHAERFEWLQWVHYSETIAVHCANLTQQFVVLNDDTLRSPTVIKLEKRRLEKAIEVIDHLLASRDYLLASGFSAADVSVGYSLHVAKLFTALNNFPRVADYYQRLASRPAFKKSLPAQDDPKRIYIKSDYCLS